VAVPHTPRWEAYSAPPDSQLYLRGPTSKWRKEKKEEEGKGKEWGEACEKCGLGPAR